MLTYKARQSQININVSDKIKELEIDNQLLKEELETERALRNKAYTDLIREFAELKSKLDTVLSIEKLSRTMEEIKEGLPQLEKAAFYIRHLEGREKQNEK